ncbi:hypothetical protein Tco_1316574 [Tanacetum coccineum]
MKVCVYLSSISPYMYNELVKDACKKSWDNGSKTWKSSWSRKSKEKCYINDGKAVWNGIEVNAGDPKIMLQGITSTDSVS